MPTATSDPGDWSRFDVVVVPFPLAHNASWPLDTSLTNLASAGLPSPSVVRMKLFTLDHRFVIRKAGRLATHDATLIETALRALLMPKNVQGGKSS